MTLTMCYVQGRYYRSNRPETETHCMAYFICRVKKTSENVIWTPNYCSVLANRGRWI